MVFSVYDFKALKSLTLTPDSGWYPRGGGGELHHFGHK
jgi:hypothetical protein